MHDCIYANKFAVANGAAFFWRLGENESLRSNFDSIRFDSKWQLSGSNGLLVGYSTIFGFLKSFLGNFCTICPRFEIVGIFGWMGSAPWSSDNTAEFQSAATSISSAKTSWLDKKKLFKNHSQLNNPVTRRTRPGGLNLSTPSTWTPQAPRTKSYRLSEVKCSPLSQKICH